VVSEKINWQKMTESKLYPRVLLNHMFGGYLKHVKMYNKWEGRWEKWS
jgi:hypothetical protein